MPADGRWDLNRRLKGQERGSGFLEGIYFEERLRWSRGSVLAFGIQVRGFKPGRSLRIFKGENILSTPTLKG
jgi:hypothetical protein